MIQMLLREHTLTITRLYLIFTSQIQPAIGADLSAKTADDSRNEFINGDAVFYQNGSWEYGELSQDIQR